MIYEGKSLSIKEVRDGLYELCFDLQNESVNKFGQSTIAELGEAVSVLQRDSDLKGLILTSAKKSFFVGADITEFGTLFRSPDDELIAGILKIHELFASLEDLPCPTVAAINGEALGGGLEICLACDYRVVADNSKVGLPEVKLGIFPGWGGTVRLPRIIGIDNAIEWMAGGSGKRPAAALKDGVADAIVPLDKLRDAALDLLQNCVDGKFDYQQRRNEKRSPLPLSTIEQTMAFESARGVVGAKAGPHYPSPMTIIDTVQKHAPLHRSDAAKVEARAFATLAKTPVSAALIGIFLKDQYLKKQSRQYSKAATEVNKAAVLGAGIMGGGIAYQSASSGVPIVMKDIAQPAIEAGLAESDKLFFKQVKRGRLDQAGAAAAMHRILPTLSYGDFADVDLVVEAVVENPEIKQSVLAEVEQKIGDSAVLTSNTSTISINQLAESLQRPELFCGMHFFNPVHLMPLVEVIRGEKTNDTAVATTVAYARRLGKTPIVVNDCPGFFVNRVLFPYFAGFSKLLEHGADFTRVDKLMERWGWPMGPAYLLDVVGLDTGHHAGQVMAAGFPDRMGYVDGSASDLLYKAERYGQKNNVGFYRYEIDRRGKPKKLADPTVADIISPAAKEHREFTDEQIVERMMIPMCIETVRCLEEGIVSGPADADMGLVYGVGFPPFRGGILHYIDSIGLDNFCRLCEQYQELGPLYQPTDGMKEMAANGQRYFDDPKA
ncbi:multifunctional fatty acid oxidation complex subunit alpha [Chromatiales bacterium (ex Bugula neritina AB1)]|nr:multifunctional fatty acid oxidation complex subunit alpha [Chromatiales bacterium (ex Bugula neritina AB1)]